LTIQTNSNEAPQTKKQISRIALIVIFETAMIGGCAIAIFTVPRSTPLSTFLIICAGALILGNVLLFRGLNKASDSSRKTNYTRLYVGLGLMLFYWVLTLSWK
jgi:hypothetical protein